MKSSCAKVVLRPWKKSFSIFFFCLSFQQLQQSTAGSEPCQTTMMLYSWCQLKEWPLNLKPCYKTRNSWHISFSGFKPGLWEHTFLMLFWCSYIALPWLLKEGVDSPYCQWPFWEGDIGVTVGIFLCSRKIRFLSRWETCFLFHRSSTYLSSTDWYLALFLRKISLTQRGRLTKPNALRPPEHSLIDITMEIELL